jgi:hypothetical protein
MKRNLMERSEKKRQDAASGMAMRQVGYGKYTHLESLSSP